MTRVLIGNVTGPQGADGVTPTFELDENGNLYYVIEDGEV